MAGRDTMQVIHDRGINAPDWVNFDIGGKGDRIRFRYDTPSAPYKCQHLGNLQVNLHCSRFLRIFGLAAI